MADTPYGRLLPLIAVLSIAASAAAAQDESREVAAEYRLKAAYLFNFTKFVEWPQDSAAGPLTVCIASQNPFGTVLVDAIRHERVNGRPLDVRVVRQTAGCDVVFIPRGVAYEPYLRAARGRPVLTVGEAPQFLDDGGIINFVVEEGRVRFEINRDAAAQANLTISSHLLRLMLEALSGTPIHQWQAE
jgi:hypothetical protein